MIATSLKKKKKKKRRKNRVSAPIVLNDDSDGEIEDTTSQLSSNPIIVPIISTKLPSEDDNDHILSPNQLDKILNEKKEDVVNMDSFDYDFLSQRTQETIQINPVPNTIPEQTSKPKKEVRLSQTPPPTFAKVNKSISKTTNAKQYKSRFKNKKKRNKKRKFKPPRLLIHSRSVPPKKHKKAFRIPRISKMETPQSNAPQSNTAINGKPPETAGFMKASNRSNRSSTSLKMKKATFNKAKLKQFMNPIAVSTVSTSKSLKSFDEFFQNMTDEKPSAEKEKEKEEEEEEEEEPYAAFISAIPEFNESQMYQDDDDDDDCANELEPTPQQLDAMSFEQYTSYKQKLKLAPTRSIASANTLKYRVIPPAKPNLSASKSCISRAKLANFNALIDGLQSSPVMKQRAAQRNRMAKVDGSANWWSKQTKPQRKKEEEAEKFEVDTVASWSRKRRMDSRYKPQPQSQPRKKRKLNTAPQTLKDIVNKCCRNHNELPIFTENELSKQFGLSSEIIHMSLMSAQQFSFNENNENTHAPFMLSEDDDDNNDNGNGAHDDANHFANDDWNNRSVVHRHIRNEISIAANSAAAIYNKGNYDYTNAYDNLLHLGCDSKLLSKQWVQHHWKMIVWSLACRVRSLPFKLCTSSYFSYFNVLQHLKYRYEHEINEGNLSTVRKIYRGDLSAACYLRLTVSRIVSTNHTNRMWLSDGWYEIEATFLDSDIESLVKCGDIKIGDKLKICLARKDGTNCEPLESKAVQVSIQISRNNVRKAAWYEKLGNAAVVPNVFRVSLRSIHCNGGCVPFIYGCVAKRYSNQYSIKIGDDKKGKVYTLKAKERLDTKYEAEHYSKMIQLRLKIAKEMGLDQFLSDSPSFNNIDMDRKELTKKMDILREKVHHQISNQMALNRKISEFFTCVIYEVGDDGDLLRSDWTEITVWNPSENVSYIMKEGNYIKIFNINTQNKVNHASNIAQLSAGTRTKFEVVDTKQMGYRKEIIQHNYEECILRTYFSFNVLDGKNVEFDMIGCIVKVMRERLFIISLTQNNCNENKLPLISMEVKQNENIVHYQSIKSNSIYIIKNVKYRGYDRNLSLHSTFSYQRTEFMSNSSRDVQFKNAKQFMMTQYAQRQIQSTLHRIDTQILNCST